MEGNYRTYWIGQSVGKVRKVRDAGSAPKGRGYRHDRFAVHVLLLYVFFILGVEALAWFSLPGQVALPLVTLVALVSLAVIVVQYTRGLAFRDPAFKEDWTVVPIENGGAYAEFRITVNNLSCSLKPEPITFKQEYAWVLKDERGTVVRVGPVSPAMKVYYSYTWVFTREASSGWARLSLGVYDVYIRSQEIPLFSIRLSD